MKNIQLELLTEVLSQLEKKRIFLYLDNPSVEPEYITIDKLFNAVDTKFTITELLANMKEAIKKFDAYDMHFDKLDNSVLQMQTIINALDTDNKQLKENVAYLLSTMTKVLSDLSLQAAKIESNRNNIVSMQSNIGTIQQSIQDIQASMGSSGTATTENFNAISWRKI